MTSSSYRMRDRIIRDHTVTVPLDWTAPDDGQTIEVFAREVAHVERQDAPILVFLQGGPGGKGPRPMPGEDWIGEALKTHRLLLLDQRGTGRSSRVEAASIAGLSAADAAEYIRKFRAEQIIADLEHLRREVFGGVRWQTLGQSYGGFLTLTYLSFRPEAVSAAYVTGGLTSFAPDATDVYRRTLPRVADKTAEFYRRYPQDADVIARVVDVIENSDVRLPSGDRLSARRLQTLGIDFGMKPGFERMHWLFDEAFSSSGRLSDHFLAEVDAHTQYWGGPLYALLQEEIYADGHGATPGRRSACARARRVRAGSVADAVHGRDVLPLDVRRDRVAAAVPRRGARPRRAGGSSRSLRRRSAASQRGADRRGDVLR